jgi:FO synthase
MSEETWAIIPVKDFARAKTRLSGVLMPAQCAALARVMAADVLHALTHAPSLDGVVVMGEGTEQAELAARFGCEFAPDDPALDLSGNLARNAKRLAARGVKTLLVVPADLPALRADDVERFLGHRHSRAGNSDIGNGDVTIARAARDGGTNALCVSPPDALEFCVGVDSARRHAESATAAGLTARIVDDPAFRSDIDVPEDLREFCSRAPDCDSLRALTKFGWTGLPDRDNLLRIGRDEPLDTLMSSAAALRDRGFGDVVTYSPKVFIPLTELCRDVCHYCTYAKTPRRVVSPFLSPEQVLEIARAGREAGCREALFTLGDKPELRYRAARDALERMGYATTLDYLAAMAELVRRETGLLPHLNAGIMTPADYRRLRTVAPSMGLMLESASTRLSERGGPHFGSPDKRPEVRIESIRAAGEAAVPFTTGILIGIGETREERIDSLLAMRALHEQHGHIQEIIVQNFVPKPGTKMADAPAPDREELLWTIAIARRAFGPHMSIQAPPNLNAEQPEQLILAGANDWGGVSPVTPDHVNPESPWPHIDALRSATARAGKQLAPRLTVYPRYVHARERWVDAGLRSAVLAHADAEGLARDDGQSPQQSGKEWAVGAGVAPPWRLADVARTKGWSNPSLASTLARTRSGESLSVDEIGRLFATRGDDFVAVCDAADELRRLAVGDDVTYVVNRNINYTNVCFYKCKFCAFSKGKTDEHLRGAPYVVDLDEIGRRTEEAWQRGGTEVCLQGGIHPSFTGRTYLDICRAAKEAAPGIHVHAFSPLEVTHGAATLGLSIEQFLRRLKAAGLGTLPGTAAEILDDEVRRFICPDKLTTREWLDVIGTAHRVGLKTTSTIMFGHMERIDHWARHLLALRELQQQTGGITEFVPLPYVHMEAPMHRRGFSRPGPTYREAILMHAVARLALYPLIDNIQVSWVKLGPDGVADCLRAGVNDLGGTLMNESISRAAGASFGQELPPQDMNALILGAGRTPRQRTTLYGEPSIVQVVASGDAAPLAPVVNRDAREYAVSAPPAAGGDPRVELSPW